MIDFGNYNTLDPKDHGTPGQRNAALDKGFLLAASGTTFENAAREGEAYVRGTVAYEFATLSSLPFSSLKAQWHLLRTACRPRQHSKIQVLARIWRGFSRQKRHTNFGWHA